VCAQIAIFFSFSWEEPAIITVCTIFQHISVSFTGGV